MQNSQKAPVVKKATFQGRIIEEGSRLFMFKYSAFVRVLALVEYGSQLCAVVAYGEAEFTRTLNSKNFMAFPSYSETLKEKNHHYKMFGLEVQEEVSFYAGSLVQNPNADNLIYVGSKKTVIRLIADCSSVVDGFFVSKMIGPGTSTKTAIPFAAFLNIFFKARRKEFDPSFGSESTIEANLRRKYQETFRMIDGLRRHPEGLSFQEWKIKKTY